MLHITLETPDLVVDTAGGVRAATVRLSQVCRYGLVPMTPVDKSHQKCGVKYANCGAPCRNCGSRDHPLTRPSRGSRALGRFDTESGASSCWAGTQTGVGEVCTGVVMIFRAWVAISRWFRDLTATVFVRGAETPSRRKRSLMAHVSFAPDPPQVWYGAPALQPRPCVGATG